MAMTQGELTGIDLPMLYLAFDKTIIICCTSTLLLFVSPLCLRVIFIHFNIVSYEVANKTM